MAPIPLCSVSMNLECSHVFGNIPHVPRGVFQCQVHTAVQFICAVCRLLSGESCSTAEQSCSSVLQLCFEWFFYSDARSLPVDVIPWLLMAGLLAAVHDHISNSWKLVSFYFILFAWFFSLLCPSSFLKYLFTLSC